MPRRTRLVGWLWRWHRRAGLLAALLLVLLALSGILLNHGNALGLDRRHVDAAWLRALYGEQGRAWVAFTAGGHWLAQGEDGALYLDGLAVGRCDGVLAGVLLVQEMLLAGCERELLLLDAGGARIDALGAATGLPAPLQGLGQDADGVLARVGGAWRRFDAERMEFGVQALPAVVSGPGELPAQLREALGEDASWLSWERLLLDLHSGRLFGRFGMLAVDLAGGLSILLSLSGVMIWSLRRRGRKP